MGRFRGAEVLLLERRHDHVGRADGRRNERRGHQELKELVKKNYYARRVTLFFYSSRHDIKEAGRDDPI